MINWDQVRQLAEDVGEDELEEVVELFLAEMDEAIDGLFNTPPQSPQDMAAAMHFLKGGAYNLGFQDFGDSCADGEGQAKDGDCGGICVDTVVALYAASRTEFLRDLPTMGRAAMA